MSNEGCAGVKRGTEDLAERAACSCCEDSDHYCKKRICAEELVINEDRQTRLHLLCQDRCCSVEEVRDLIVALPQALEQRDAYGRSVRQTNTQQISFFFSRS
jgi:hypothetical protein